MKETSSKSTGNTGEIANEAEKSARKLEAARAQQRSVESGEVVLKTTKRKGNYGEMKMDDFFESQTYTRISDDRVLTLDQKIVKGIDAVYENASPPPKYVIAEAKYNTSKFGKTNDGKQSKRKVTPKYTIKVDFEVAFCLLHFFWHSTSRR
ncbi:hypothetical protein COL91_14365 [Bacillus pseudomycoides]|nr:hypothetical protein [Bacillus pseudomycoides]PEE34459.1 hypothetical protein COO02_28215 [Bacillus pseudomycoides]PGA90255.1 hypothetical protein COL91_14365 [Bacillus pseudomycoides]PHF36099.1 hypothetical protein COF72_24725 [Bacillus pseudomycoides]